MSWQLILAGLLLTVPNYFTGTGARFQSRSREVLGDLTLERLIDEASRSQTNIEEIKKDVIEPSATNTGSDTGTGTGTDTGTSADKPDSAKAPTKTENKTTQAPLPGKAQPQVQSKGGGDVGHNASPFSGVLFIVIVAACSVAGLVGLIMAGVCWFKLNRNAKATSDVDYPAYGVTGPNKERVPSPGDRKLAQSAQMYHYQHQKQQMIAMEKANGEMKHDASDDESEEENEEGDYTVYECPGLAPTGEMEVKNPLFNEESQVTGDDDHKDHN